MDLSDVPDDPSLLLPMSVELWGYGPSMSIPSDCNRYTTSSSTSRSHSSSRASSASGNSRSHLCARHPKRILPTVIAADIDRLLMSTTEPHPSDPETNPLSSSTCSSCSSINGDSSEPDLLSDDSLDADSEFDKDDISSVSIHDNARTPKGSPTSNRFQPISSGVPVSSLSNIIQKPEYTIASPIYECVKCETRETVESSKNGFVEENIVVSNSDSKKIDNTLNVRNHRQSCSDYDPVTPVGSQNILNEIKKPLNTDNEINEEFEAQLKEYENIDEDICECNNQDAPKTTMNDMIILDNEPFDVSTKQSRKCSTGQDSSTGSSNITPTRKLSTFLSKFNFLSGTSKSATSDSTEPDPESLPHECPETSTLAFCDTTLRDKSNAYISRKISIDFSDNDPEIMLFGRGRRKTQSGSSSRTSSIEKISQLKRPTLPIDKSNKSQSSSVKSSPRNSPLTVYTESERYFILKHSPSEKLAAELKDSPNHAYQIFFKHHTCYDLIPNSSRLVIFDIKLQVRKAFFALVNNGVRAALLWDSQKQAYVGMLTITDFMRILHRFYRPSDQTPATELHTHRISTWRDLMEESLSGPLHCISPETSLLDAVTALLSTKVHRIPIIDPQTGNPLHILTHKRILKFLHQRMSCQQKPVPQPSFLSQSLGELGLGTYEEDGICKIAPSCTLIQAFDIFVTRVVSSLPIVDEENRLIDVYTKFDVINLAATNTYTNLDVSVMEALAYKKDRVLDASTCFKTDTLQQIIDKIVSIEVHRLIILDTAQCVIGIVALSDILSFLIKPLDMPVQATKL